MTVVKSLNICVYNKIVFSKIFMSENNIILIVICLRFENCNENR